MSKNCVVRCHIYSLRRVIFVYRSALFCFESYGMRSVQMRISNRYIREILFVCMEKKIHYRKIKRACIARCHSVYVKVIIFTSHCANNHPFDSLIAVKDATFECLLFIKFIE